MGKIRLRHYTYIEYIDDIFSFLAQEEIISVRVNPCYPLR
ncbi:hypothetical protein Mpsy_0921 [Methanolobus psychrophilus R15]|nr:hypothetical protein Mpsy_0921 [Methanolobus psychrophilus R15]